MEQVFSQIKYIRDSLSLNYQIKRLESSKTKYLKHFTSWSSIYLASGSASLLNTEVVKVGPPVHNYEHEAGSYGDGFT